jgi:protocatechuate 3,4-dioxygenase beta subunit
MDNDDKPIGRVLSRREALVLLAMAGVGALAACTPAAATGTSTAAATSTSTAEATSTSAAATSTAAATSAAATSEATAVVDVPTQTVASGTVAAPACIVRPEVTEGPFYVAEDLLRSDIRTDSSTGAVKAGTPLTLRFLVSQVTAESGCTALEGATVEVWHCDAAGAYSDVTDRGSSTVGQDFLRGAQVTDANGVATFATIYPGWYSGRTVHIHFKVRPNANQVFTSQVFFDDALTDVVFQAEPYASQGQRNTLNSNDGIYDDTLLLTTTAAGDGYEAVFPIGVDLTTLGDGSNAGGPGGRP